MIWVFGDSFSTNDTNYSWTKILGASVVSQNGISEYRILQNIKNTDIGTDDIVILCHTNPHRIYLPDRIPYPARTNTTHPKCDLVISDSMSRNFLWRFISKIYFKYFFDERHSTEIHNLIILGQKAILKDKTDNIIEVSGFDGQPNSFYDIYATHSGKINHMNELGNVLVAERIRRLIDVQMV